MPSSNMETNAGEERLPIELHNPLQEKVIELMLGKRMEEYAAQSEWFDKYLIPITTIVNGPEGKRARDLAREGKIDEAARLVQSMLEKETVH